eukprot:5419498-Karenia_brevis.AAC.1
MVLQQMRMGLQHAQAGVQALWSAKAERRGERQCAKELWWLKVTGNLGSGSGACSCGSPAALAAKD